MSTARKRTGRRTARASRRGTTLAARGRLYAEPLEQRRLLTLVWANRGDASDMFDAAFGANAELARGVVDSALDEWNRVVTGYQGASFNTQMTIMMNPSNPATSAAASNTVPDSNGVPISSTVTINMALDMLGNTQWYLDPTPNDHSEFMGPLVHAFARNPTPGGPADGLRDLRTLLIHELGHTMGIANGSPLMYSNANVTMTNTGITDNSVGTGSNSYWLFQGPSVNAVMTDFDINAGVTTTAGHVAMPLAGNTPINFGGQLYYTAVDTMQPTSLSIRRILLTKKTALMMQDMGYDVVMPETFGTFHSVLNAATGQLTIQGGNDNTLINNINQGASSDTITLFRAGGALFLGIDVGVDVPGTGAGMTPLDQQGIFISQFNVADVNSITINGFDGDDVINFIGDFDFLANLLVFGDEGDDQVDGSGIDDTQSLVAFGGEGNDTLTGGPGVDLLAGDVGNDSLIGGAGGDVLIGGTGNDAISGGTGNDTIDGNAGNDTLLGQGGNDSIDAGSGNDFVLGGSFLANIQQVVPDGGDTIDAGSGNDFVLGDNALGTAPTPFGGSADLIEGGAGNDTLIGGIGGDDLSGDDGHDVLVGYAGNDGLDGGEGNDSLFGDTGNDILDGGEGADFLDGDDGNDVLDGAEGNDELFGGDDNDSLDGALGNDTLHGEAGNDQLVGGLGADSLFGEAGADLLLGGTLFSLFLDNSSDTLAGGTGNDTLLGDNFGLGPGIGGGDALDGEAGNDTIFGQYGDDSILGGLGADELHGGDGDDVLIGGTFLIPIEDASGDLLFGDAGDDTLTGDNANFSPVLGGNDTLNGGSGDDSLTGQAGHDLLEGGSGDDTLNGNDGNDSLRGGADDDELDGGAGHDTLEGDVGDDSLVGDIGDDSLSGGAGDDELDGGDDADRLEGDAGNDTLSGGNGDDTLGGGDDDDLLRGGNGEDQLDGAAGNDILLGDAERDILVGGLGRDILIGGRSEDRITGGEEDDILVAGFTVHDADDDALLAMRDEWASSRSYEERVANLRNEPNPTFDDRLNGDFFLRAGVDVFDDGGGNALSGLTERDWFFASLADVTDQEPGEELN